MNKKHRWTFEEDEICCRRYVEEYVIKKSNLEIKEFINILNKSLEEVERLSIRMKIQNIKGILKMLEVEDSGEISLLSNWSKQNEKALKKVLKLKIFS